MRPKSSCVNNGTDKERDNWGVASRDEFTLDMPLTFTYHTRTCA
jgi:hypothetical protein